MLSFGAKDVKKILESDYCPYCCGLNPIILLSFKKLEPAETQACLADGSPEEIQSPVLSEEEFSDRIQAIQNKYQKRGSIELFIFLIVWFSTPIIFGIAVSTFALEGLALLAAIFGLLAVSCLLFWWLHASDLKKFKQNALACPSCCQEVIFGVAERTDYCPYCGNKLFAPKPKPACGKVE